MEVDKYWSELTMIMCEDESGHVKPTEEKELMGMWIEDFFIKLLVFKERMNKRLENARNQNGKTHA